MDLKTFFISNKKGEKSATLTAFCYGFIIVNLKLVFSGMTIMTLTLAPFTGTEYGIAVAALGSIYVLNKTQRPKDDGSKPSSPE